MNWRLARALIIARQPHDAAAEWVGGVLHGRRLRPQQILRPALAAPPIDRYTPRHNLMRRQIGKDVALHRFDGLNPARYPAGRRRRVGLSGLTPAAC